MLDRLRALDSCAVSDALDTLGLPGAVTGIGPLWAVRDPVAGRVRTVLAGPRQSDRPAQHIAAAAIEAAGRGDVLVIANAGRTDVSCWGGILTLAATRQASAAWSSTAPAGTSPRARPAASRCSAGRWSRSARAAGSCS